MKRPQRSPQKTTECLVAGSESTGKSKMTQGESPKEPQETAPASQRPPNSHTYPSSHSSQTRSGLTDQRDLKTSRANSVLRIFGTGGQEQAHTSLAHVILLESSKMSCIPLVILLSTAQEIKVTKIISQRGPTRLKKAQGCLQESPDASEEGPT